MFVFLNKYLFCIYIRNIFVSVGCFKLLLSKIGCKFTQFFPNFTIFSLILLEICKIYRKYVRLLGDLLAFYMPKTAFWVESFAK